MNIDILGILEEYMDILGKVVMLLAGCGVFMLGFKLLSTHMEKLAGNGLKSFFNKISNNKFLGLFIGMLTTIVIQSSSVTTVMVVGFVNSGIMSLIQATAVIIGANIGTTITAYIAALNSGAGVVADILNYSFLACLFVGVFLEMFAKSDKKKSVGLILAGLGAVFLGLETMSDSMSFMRDVPAINNFIAGLSNPFLLLIIGLVFTAIVQSSSAVTSIIVVIAASVEGAFGGSGNAVYFLILGSNIGTCVTAMLSSVGASTNARRASMIHLLFNTFGAIIFTILLLSWKGFSATIIESWITDKVWQIALFHTIFNCTCAIIFLPLSKYLVKLATILVPDKKVEEEKSPSELVFMDKRLLSSPNIAVGMLKKDVFRMADMSMDCLNVAFNGFVKRDIEIVPVIELKNEQIAKLGRNITDALVGVSSNHNMLDLEKQINDLHTNVGDIVRVAELAENLAKYTKREIDQEIYFSDDVIEKLREMCGLLNKQYELVKAIVLDGQPDSITKVDEYEDMIDNMRRVLVSDHIERLSQGKCRPENNAIFINLVSNLERIGDHLSFIVRG